MKLKTKFFRLLFSHWLNELASSVPPMYSLNPSMPFIYKKRHKQRRFVDIHLKLGIKQNMRLRLSQQQQQQQQQRRIKQNTKTVFNVRQCKS